MHARKHLPVAPHFYVPFSGLVRSCLCLSLQACMSACMQARIYQSRLISMYPFQFQYVHAKPLFESTCAHKCSHACMHVSTQSRLITVPFSGLVRTRISFVWVYVRAWVLKLVGSFQGSFLFCPLFQLSFPKVPASALWSRMIKNSDVSTEPLARLFAHLLARLTCSLALPASLRSLTHYAHSLTRGKVDNQMAIFSVFFFPFWTIVVWMSESLKICPSVRQKPNEPKLKDSKRKTKSFVSASKWRSDLGDKTDWRGNV